MRWEWPSTGGYLSEAPPAIAPQVEVLYRVDCLYCLDAAGAPLCCLRRAGRLERQPVGRGTMQQRRERLAVLFVLVVGLMVALAAPAGAATTQLSGVGVFDTTGVCPDPPTGFEDFTSLPPMVMTG